MTTQDLTAHLPWALRQVTALTPAQKDELLHCFFLTLCATTCNLAALADIPEQKRSSKQQERFTAAAIGYQTMKTILTSAQITVEP